MKEHKEIKVKIEEFHKRFVEANKNPDRPFKLMIIKEKEGWITLSNLTFKTREEASYMIYLLEEIKLRLISDLVKRKTT